MMILNHTWGKPPIETPKDTPVLGEIDSYLIETLYKAEDSDAGLESIVNNERFKQLIEQHDLALFGGPMLGGLTHNSASVWLRTPGAAKVKLHVQPKVNLSLIRIRTSDTITTKAENDFTAVLEVKGLSPASLYEYNILVDGKPVYPKDLPEFRTYPAKKQKAVFKVGFGGGARYVPEKEKMWDVIASHDPDAFLFLGDNVYIDKPLRRNAQRVHYYRRQLRPEFRRLTEKTSIYAIWDDHDFGGDDSTGGPHRFKPDWKLPVWRVFKENWNNPYYGGGDELPGCWFDFSIGDVDFFMLDGRYYRDGGEGAKKSHAPFKKGKENKTMLGSAQKKWLIENLKTSEATFKIIASPVQWTEHADKGGGDSWWGVRDERKEIFDLIEDNEIGGVILLSADRHRTDVFKMERDVGYDLYEFSTSKLTNNHTHGTKEQAVFSYNKGNYFGLLMFDFTKPDPEVTFECITMENESVYKLTLNRSQLEPR